MTITGVASRSHGRHHPPPGRRNAPPDDKLQRMIQYARVSLMELKGCGLLDTPQIRGV
jgi:hypothetical protein